MKKSARRNLLSTSAIVLAASWPVSFPLSSIASDWGYDGGSGSVEETPVDDAAGSVKELDATAGTLGGPALEIKPVTTPSPAKPATDRAVDVDIKDPRLKKAAECWLQLYGLVAPIAKNGRLIEGDDLSANLSPEQKSRFRSYLAGGQSNKNEVVAILDYWPQVSDRIRDLDQRGNFRLLFRALLRLKARSKSTSEAEKQVIKDSLGPEVVAEPGDPPLTDEAIAAYADMTCFLYEKKNPGRTVDADDNRELFSMVLKGKFRDAPSDRDRAAMANFPLNWAKFRILYTDADEGDRDLLLRKLANASGTRNATVANQLLEKVLVSSPWKEVVLGSKK
ncbi:MAG: hypothetical protein AB7V06_21555 [Candidatus Obscuribacterales bacterium]